jgi:hypothetical protein
MRPVWSAKEKVQAGPLVLARDIEKSDWTDPRLMTEFGVNYKDGGLVHMQSGGNPKTALLKTMASKALPAAERDANLAKFLAPSQEQRRMYHGTTGDINKFNPNNRITFLTPDPKFANTFASKKFNFTDEGQSLGAKPEIMPGANVMPVHVQAENIFNPYKPSHLYALHDKLMQNHPELGSSKVRDIVYNVKDPHENWQAVEDPMVQNAIKDMGHDAFVSTEYGVQNLGVYDPRRIKSAIGNEGTYNTRDLDVNKAEGGLVHLAAGGKPGLYANIHAKQERIKHGSGEKMRKPGSEGAPTAEAFRKSAKTAKRR